MHLLGTIGATIIMILMIPQLLDWWTAGNIHQQQKLAADHMTKVVDATQQYIMANQGDLLGGASAPTSTSGPQLSIADLRNDHFLPANFSNVNVWRQGYNIYIRQPQEGTLQGIVVTTGGIHSTSNPANGSQADKFHNATVPGAATLVGGAGGFTGSGQGGKAATTLYGASNGWNIPLASVGITSPGAGQLGAVTWYSSSALGQDFLYRVSIPGLPELNQMQTALDMTDHSINNVHDLQFTEREINSETCSSADDYGRVFLDKNFGLYICRNGKQEIISDSGNTSQVKTTTIASNGDKITKPTCATNTETVPVIFTSPTIFEAGPQAPSMTSVQSWAEDNNTYWTVRMRVQTADKNLSYAGASADSDGWIYPTANYGKIFVMTLCQKSDDPNIQ